MFRKGQKVWDFLYGWGVVERIEPSNDYPIEVRFPDTTLRTYTCEGRQMMDRNPTLFINSFQVPEVSEPLPDLKVDDRVLVNLNGDWNNRHFAGWDNGFMLVWSSGRTSWTTNIKCAFGEWRLPDED